MATKGRLSGKYTQNAQFKKKGNIKIGLGGKIFV